MLHKVIWIFFKSPKKIHKKSPISDLPRFDDSHDGLIFKSPPSYDDPRLHRSQDRDFDPRSCSSSKRGKLFMSDADVYPSTFHSTPEKREFSKDEWERFTKESTEKALEELVSSPDFSQWLLNNTERISITPQSRRNEKSRKWLGLL